MSKISVIIPVYNAEKYLGQCLDSLIGQTFSDFEIICVNDGSNDSSLDILNNYADKCDKIKIINIENSGPGPARNKGLDIASGDYITFVDADDWVDKKFLEILYASAIKTNADITECSLCSYYEASSIYKNILQEKGLQSNCQITISGNNRILQQTGSPTISIFNIKTHPLPLRKDYSIVIQAELQNSHQLFFHKIGMPGKKKPEKQHKS